MPDDPDAFDAAIRKYSHVTVYDSGEAGPII
jgi:hypothetical protein